MVFSTSTRNPTSVVVSHVRPMPHNNLDASYNPQTWVCCIPGWVTHSLTAGSQQPTQSERVQCFSSSGVDPWPFTFTSQCHHPQNIRTPARISLRCCSASPRLHPHCASFLLIAHSMGCSEGAWGGVRQLSWFPHTIFA